MQSRSEIWTRDKMRRRMRYVGQILKTIPGSGKPGGYGSLLSGYFAQLPDGYMFAQDVPATVTATPQQVTILDKAMIWLEILNIEQRKLVWGRATGIRMRWLARRMGVSLQTAHIRHSVALDLLCDDLNKLGIRCDVKEGEENFL